MSGGLHFEKGKMTNSEKNAARRERTQQKLESGLVSEHFPKVSSIVIDVRNCYGKINPITVLRTLNFWPNSYAYFNIECLSKGCLDGGFDLDQVVTTMVKGHKGSGEGEIVCDGNNLSSDHSNIHYKINIQYNKKT
jgi:hypothetical protein